jgi:hypothetical protein
MEKLAVDRSMHYLFFNDNSMASFHPSYIEMHISLCDMLSIYRQLVFDTKVNNNS